MRALLLAFSAVAIAAGFAPAAQAQQCGPLRQALSLDLIPGAAGGPRFGVPVTVNGTPRTLLLNTDYNESRVSRAVVNDLKLSPRPYGKMLALNGQVMNGYMVTVDLGIGSSLVKGAQMLVDENDGAFDGHFAGDLMQRYDIEMDFTARKLNYFLPDHCEGKVVYWPTTGFTSIPIHGWGPRSLAASGTGITAHPQGLTITAAIDGHEVQATINTHLAQTTLDSETAHALFDLTADSPGAVPLGSMDGTQAHRRFGYVFKTLSFGGITLQEPHVMMVPDLLGTRSSDTVQADSRIQRVTQGRLPTMRIGMDILRNLHLYIATKEQKLYLTVAPLPRVGRGAAAP